MLQTLRRLQKREDGATAVEYVLLVVAIALIMVVGAFTLGNTLNEKFDSTSDCVANPTSAGCDTSK
jgi:Flp pilus assembly pilin Flp